MSNIQHTLEQEAIFTATRSTQSNLMFDALAGTGKTSTLEVVDKIAKEKPACYLVFNRRNADEATTRMLSTTTVRTFNGLGHRIWQPVIKPRLKLEKNKTYLLFKAIADDLKGTDARAVWDSYDQVKTGVELAKANGYIPEGIYVHAKRLINRNQLHNCLDEDPDDLTTELIDTILSRSITQAYEGIIDFNDQIYMPALFNGDYPKFPLTLVDEYQDLNPTNHEMIRKLIGKRRLIGVGDPNQNIYGFRGAKAAGMQDAVNDYSMQRFNLSISFRCPSAIVKYNHSHVPHFKWHHEGGSVEQLDKLAIGDIPENAVFLCRLNAPLFSLAMKLIASGRGVNLAGSDVSGRLVTIMRKLGDEDTSQNQSLDLVAEWLAAKLAKNSKTAIDTAECMKVFIRQSRTLGIAIGYAEHLFKQRGPIQLMTGHKSKGLEFPLVYHLDPHVIGTSAQDKNIRYVIQTRSSDQLKEVDLRTIN